MKLVILERGCYTKRSKFDKINIMAYAPCEDLDQPMHHFCKSVESLGKLRKYIGCLIFSWVSKLFFSNKKVVVENIHVVSK